jgi:NAD(P)-dependent dehydrogenase (short-subunit alcohol dehydrogenase family)
MKELGGKTAFITGGAQGIGLGIARACAAEGMNVALVDVDAERLREAEAEIAKWTGVATAVLDVRDREAYARVADDVESRLGPVSLLCNNAGIGGMVAVTNMSYAAWDWVLGINLNGVYNGIQTFVPRMIARRAGHVVSTSSGAGLAAPGAGFLYHAAKFGVVGLSESLRAELAPFGIGVTVLCPGPVATRIMANTERLQPVVDGRSRVMEGLDGFLETTTEFLASRGVSPDDVGRMVLRGVRDDALYVHTDDIMRGPVQARTKALLDAMPPRRR